MLRGSWNTASSRMRRIKVLFSVVLAGAMLTGSCAGFAQQTFLQAQRRHNAEMTELQPTWMGPVMQSDPRLSQSVRLSFSSFYAPGLHTVIYGNNHGVSMIAAKRFQIDFVPPSYFQNHSATLDDGFGNIFTQVKYRIASGNAEHGNFAVTAILTYGFAPRIYQNGLLTSVYGPKVAAGVARGHFNVQTTLGGMLPSSKVDLQGRAIEWNTTLQWHANPHVYVDVEDNTAFNLGGPLNGKTQNFVTPAAYYVVKGKEWKPTHPVFVFDAGMQIATTSFHLYNHNLVSEMRILF